MGFAAGNGGIILKTVNKGLTWSGLHTGTANTLFSVNFTDISTGYAAGLNGTLVKTENGGTTWIAIGVGTGYTLSSVCFSDKYTGYIVGENGMIFKTIDGGSSWMTQSSGTANDLWSVFLRNADTGYIVGANGTILKTANGGYPVGSQHNPTISGSLKIFPNPSSDRIHIESSKLTEQNQLLILNLNGQIVMRKNIRMPESILDIHSLPAGIYILRMIGEREIETRKFIKE